MNRYERFRRFCVVAGWLYFCFMAYMLLHPRPPIPPIARFNFGYVHFCAFIVLGAIVGLARKKTSSYYWFGILFVWCAGSEFLQRYTGRNFELRDIIQNTLGVGVGLPIGAVLRTLLIKRLSGERKAGDKAETAETNG